MFTRFILVCFAIGFLFWLILADYLWYLYVMDIDKFWITISIAGFILLASSFWMVLSARLNNIEHDQEINTELNTGKRAANDLVNHLLAMGAGACSIPVTVDGKQFEVVVKPADIKTEDFGD